MPKRTSIISPFDDNKYQEPFYYLILIIFTVIGVSIALYYTLD